MSVRAHLDCAVFATWLQPQHPESFRNDHPLLPVVGGRNTFKQLEAFEGCCTACSLVGHHATDGAVKNLGGCAVMEGAGLFGIHDVTFMEEVVVSQLQSKARRHPRQYTCLPSASSSAKA